MARTYGAHLIFNEVIHPSARAPFYLPTSKVDECQFFYTPVNTWYGVFLYNFSLFIRCLVVSHCGFNFHFPDG